MKLYFVWKHWQELIESVQNEGNINSYRQCFGWNAVGGLGLELLRITLSKKQAPISWEGNPDEKEYHSVDKASSDCPEERWGRVFTAKVDGARGPAGAAPVPGADE